MQDHECNQHPDSGPWPFGHASRQESLKTQRAQIQEAGLQAKAHHQSDAALCEVEKGGSWSGRGGCETSKTCWFVRELIIVMTVWVCMRIEDLGGLRMKMRHFQGWPIRFLGYPQHQAADDTLAFVIPRFKVSPLTPQWTYHLNHWVLTGWCFRVRLPQDSSCPPAIRRCPAGTGSLGGARWAPNVPMLTAKRTFVGVMARPMAREATAEMRRSRRVDERTAPPRFRDDVSRVLCFYLPLQLHRSPLETWCAAAMGVPPHVLHVKFWPSWQTVAPKFEKCWARVGRV